MPRSIAERLEALSIPEPNTGCRLWLSAAGRHGHGQVWLNGRARQAHRVAWELRNGPVPKGMVVCHKCDVPSCINPDHLWIGTVTENNADRDAKGRMALGEKVGSSKLSAEEVIRILGDSRPQAEIAAAHGVSQKTISNVQRRIYWGHVRHGATAQ